MAALLRTFVGLLVVAAGVAAAIPFRRSAPPPVVDLPEPNMVWRRPDVVLDVTPARLPTTQSPAAAVVPPLIRAPRKAAATTKMTKMGPAFEAIPGSVSEPRGVAITSSESAAAPEPGKPAESESSAASRAPAAPETVAGRRTLAERRHQVVDGDDLRQLADRYLGSSERWREIYEANRISLMNPELLPIGIELRIPVTLENGPTASLKLRKQ